MTSIALTGASGNVGGHAAQLLDAAGVPARLLLREPSRAPQLTNAEIVRAEYGGEDCRNALRGIDTVLLVSAHEEADRVGLHRSFVDAATAAGVRQIVYTSFVGASESAGFMLARDHGATEHLIRDSGLGFTFLRDNFYAEAIAGFARDDGAIRGVIRGPAGQGQVACVSRRDVSAVAAEVLRSPAEHFGRTYDLTGPEAIDLEEVARVLSDVSGKPHFYVDETMEQARASRGNYGAPEWLIDAWISTYTAIGDGELDNVSHDIPTIIGRPATEFSDVVRELFAM